MQGLTFTINSSTSIANQAKIFTKYIDDMEVRNGSMGNSYGIMLAGDPGIGKTTFMKNLGKLLGIEVTIIEAPHVIEEHLIRIPFIVYNPSNDTQKKGVSQGKLELDKKGDFLVVYSNNYLLQEMKKSRVMSDTEYLKHVYENLDRNLINVFEELGGDKDTIPDEIRKARTFSNILFIDEYFRTANTKITNILRGVLGGNLGDVSIPKGIYVAYASNVKDEGIASIQAHQVFDTIEMETPSKDDWFTYLVNKFEKDKQGVKLKPELLNKLHKTIEDEHISHNDLDTDIRTSPRRWENLILLINETLPVHNLSEAKSLLANVTANFTDNEKTVSGLGKLVIKAITELITETSSVTAEELAEDTEEPHWEEQLRQQISAKVKLGNHRQYIPLIAGDAGVGKTTGLEQLAKEFNMGYIKIDVPTLDKDSVIGTPVTKESVKSILAKGEEVDFAFTTPKLLKTIQDKIKNIESNLKPKGTNGFKYMIFFDELDKPQSIDVFNALRKIILEKEFANGEKIPDGTVMVAAMNRQAMRGSTKLTKHMSDVVDMIHAEPSKTKTLDFLSKELENHEHVDEKNKQYIPRFVSAWSDVMEHFGSTEAQGKERGAFYLNVGGGMTLYFSPRDYTSAIIKAIHAYGKIVDKINKGKYQDVDPQIVSKDIKNAVSEPLERVMRTNFLKEYNDMGADFISKFHNWFEQDSNVSSLLKDVTVAVTKGGRLDKAFKKILENENYDYMNDKDLIEYFTRDNDETDFAKQLNDFLESYIKKGGLKPVELHKPIKDYIDESNPESGTVTTTVGGTKKLIQNILTSSTFSTLLRDLERDMASKPTDKNLAAIKKHLGDKKISDYAVKDVKEYLEGKKGFWTDYKDYWKQLHEMFVPVMSNLDDYAATRKLKAGQKAVVPSQEIFISKGNKNNENTTEQRMLYAGEDVLVNNEGVHSKREVKDTDLLKGEGIIDDVSTLWIKQSKAHENAYKLFKGENGIENFIGKIKEMIKEMEKSNTFVDTLNKALGDELRKLEDEYLRAGFEKHNILTPPTK